MQPCTEGILAGRHAEINNLYSREKLRRAGFLYYEDGTLQMECTYRSGQLDGPLTRYYSTGMRKEEIHYRRDKADSIYRFWDVTGDLLVQAVYHDSLLDGKFLEYYPGNKLKTEGFYKQGLYEGKWYWYDTDGMIAGTGDFSAGAGFQKSFYPDGSVEQVVRFRKQREGWSRGVL